MAGLSCMVMLPVVLLCWAAQIGATTFPSMVEVDLIFPQNETYAPTTIFPLVFAWQNTALAPSLNPSIMMSVRLFNGSKYEPELTQPSLDLRHTNFSASDPTFVYGHLRNFTWDAGDGPVSVMLSWDTNAGNCSDHGETYGGGYVSGGRVEFTVQRGGQQPDLVAATSGKRCEDMTHAAFNLTGTQKIYPQEFRPHDTCAVFSGMQPRPEGDTCQVQVSPSAASSIAAALASKECAFPTPLLDTCKSSNAAAGKKQRFMRYLIASGLLIAIIPL